jgi:hypothetical protein
VRGGAAAGCRPEPVADLDALDRLDPHEGPGQPGVEAPVPVHVAADAGGQPVGEHLDDTADGVAGPAAVVDLGHHPGAGRSVVAADGVGVQPCDVVGQRQLGAVRDGDGTDRDGVADQADAGGLPQERRGDRAEGDAGRGLPGGGPLEHRTGVVEAVLLHADEVGVAGARPGEGSCPGLLGEDLRRHWIGCHDRLPLGPFGVRDLDRDRAALGAPVPDPAEEGHLVLLERHPGAASVPEPAAGERQPDVVRGHLDRGRQPLEDADESGPVGLPRGQPAQHGPDPPTPVAVAQGSVVTCPGHSVKLPLAWVTRAQGGSPRTTSVNVSPAPKRVPTGTLYVRALTRNEARLPFQAYSPT